MSQNLAELLELLVDDFYGEIASSVFSVLARHGRLSISGLLQYSSIPLRIIRPGLVTLIQQHLVYHFTEGKGTTYYEVNQSRAYMLVRSGKVLGIVEGKFGSEGEEIARTLMSEGHATLTDLAEAYDLNEDEDETQDNHANGDSVPNGINGQNHDRQKAGKQIRSFKQLERLLQKMKKAGYVVPVTTKSFWSPDDVELAAEELARRARKGDKAPNGKKQREETSRAINSHKRRWRDMERDESEHEEESTEPAVKKVKTNGMTNGTNGVNGRYAHASQHQPVYMLNYGKIDVMLRAKHLTDLADRYVGRTSSKIYQALLETMAERQPRCFDDLQAPTATKNDDESDDDDDDHIYDPIIPAVELLDGLPEDFDLSRGIVTQAPQQTSGKNGTQEANGDTMIGTNNDEEDDDDDVFGLSLTARRDHDNKHKIQQIARHLDILANSPLGFCRRIGDRGGGQYRVDFRTLCAQLVQRNIEDAVTSRFGNEAARLIRILAAKGKLDDRMLGVMSLQRAKDVKMILLELQTAGFLDLQEIPRDAHRAPQRTIYMYFYDRDRVRRKMLDDTYKTMSRVLQRGKVERERVRLVIEKAERSDVQGNEDKYLSNAELQDLRGWQEKEDRLLLAVTRCDDVVADLRDFLPEGESM